MTKLHQIKRLAFDRSAGTISNSEFLAKLHELVARAIEEERRLHTSANDLCDKLDKQWYEADPFDEVKLGEPHPWSVQLRSLIK